MDLPDDYWNRMKLGAARALPAARGGMQYVPRSPHVSLQLGC